MPRQKSFASLTVDQLLELRNSLDKYLGEKREQLQNSLGALERISGLNQRGKPGRNFRGAHPSKGKKVAPKYRNPDDPSQTWAGRGAQPRWLKAHLSAGRSREEFAISGSGSRKQRRKPGRKRKAA
jgi:DNA-binding protein H-NS